MVNRLGHVSERHKFDHTPVTIGRSYRNDLILNDQHVSPQHLLITEAESGWKAHDQGSHNGVFIKQANNSVQRLSNDADWIQLDSGDELIIGKSRLRFYSVDHPVAETQMLPRQDAFSRTVARPWISTAIVIMCLLLYCFNNQLASTKELSLDKLIAMSLPPMFLALVWAGIWAFVGRVLKHEANFSVQFGTTVLFSIGILLLSTAKEYILYNSGSYAASLILETLATGMLLATLLYINMENSSNASLKTRLWTSHGIAWGVLLAGLFISFANKPEFRHSPSFPSVLKAPFAKVVPSKSFENFLADSEQLFSIDEATSDQTSSTQETTRTTPNS